MLPPPPIFRDMLLIKMIVDESQRTTTLFNRIFVKRIKYYKHFFLVCFRGHGPLKNTMDVINAAKKISEAGSKLDNLCRQIADQVNSYFLYSPSKSKILLRN